MDEDINWMKKVGEDPVTRLLSSSQSTKDIKTYFNLHRKRHLNALWMLGKAQIVALDNLEINCLGLTIGLSLVNSWKYWRLSNCVAVYCLHLLFQWRRRDYEPTGAVILPLFYHHIKNDLLLNEFSRLEIQKNLFRQIWKSWQKLSNE